MNYQPANSQLSATTTDETNVSVDIGLNSKTSKHDHKIQKITAGLWIDHRKAVIVMISPDIVEILEIRSNVEKQHGRLDGVRSTTPYESQLVQASDSHEREFTGQLNEYYAEVIAVISDCESILIFGPGEAKVEFKKRIEHVKLGGRVIAMEATDKMTDRQITAKVRKYFHK